MKQINKLVNRIKNLTKDSNPVRDIKRSMLIPPKKGNLFQNSIIVLIRKEEEEMKKKSEKQEEEDDVNNQVPIVHQDVSPSSTINGFLVQPKSFAMSKIRHANGYIMLWSIENSDPY